MLFFSILFISQLYLAKEYTHEILFILFKESNQKEVGKMYFDDSDEEEAKIDDLWTFHPAAAEEEISEAQKKENILARNKSRKILETM